MIIISFESTNYAMMADKYFTQADFEKMVIPTPRIISNSCGISLKINDKDIEKAQNLIKEKNIKIKGIFKIQNNNLLSLGDNNEFK